MTYEYWLEHVSAAMGPDAQLKEALMINDLHARLQPKSTSEADHKLHIDDSNQDKMTQIIA